MKQSYVSWTPSPASVEMIDQANAICADYKSQGYDLTLRQLYYQFVSRGLIENSQRSYKRLGDVINNARMAGRLDWWYIVDRTRNLAGGAHWTDPAEIVRSAATGYRIDKREDQEVYVEVWVEKEALAGVIGRAAHALDVNYFSCRGYVSQSEQHAAAERFQRRIEMGQKVVVVHLGDHDPSGIDMTRDIEHRISRFLTVGLGYIDADEPLEPEADADTLLVAGHQADGFDQFPELPLFSVRRIALNGDQIAEFNPPPNPAKLTDSRIGSYLAEYGDKSWELDALEPSVLDGLIRDEVAVFTEWGKFDALRAQEAAERATLAEIADNYHTLTWPGKAS